MNIVNDRYIYQYFSPKVPITVIKVWAQRSCLDIGRDDNVKHWEMETSSLKQSDWVALLFVKGDFSGRQIVIQSKSFFQLSDGHTASCYGR